MKIAKLKDKQNFTELNITPMETSQFMSGIPSTSLTTTLTKERHSRITNILTEIRKEKPLGKCPLFKMVLTFRSFVWSPSIDSIYSFNVEQKSVKPLQTQINTLASRKPLVRSHSFTSVESSAQQNFQIPSIDCVDISVLPVKTERKDAIRLNMLSTVASTAIKVKSKNRNTQQSDLSTQRSHKLGVVPKYLTSRKAQWAQMEEEKQKRLPDPDCPIGHVMMPEFERLETLNRLKQSQIILNEEFNSLPLSKDSLKIRQKKEDIEKQLTKVEEGIRVLSKPKVFVRTDI